MAGQSRAAGSSSWDWWFLWGGSGVGRRDVLPIFQGLIHASFLSFQSRSSVKCPHELLEESFPALWNVAHAVPRFAMHFIVQALLTPFGEAVFHQVGLSNYQRFWP